MLPINTGPLIDVGNVRAVSFIAPQLLGGAAPMLRYRQRVSSDGIAPAPGGDARDQQGGLLVLGGQFDVHAAGTRKVAAVEVGGAGRGVSLLSVKFAALPSVPAVRIADDYRFDVSMLGSTCRWVGPSTAVVQDDRTADVRRHWGATPVDGDLHVRSGDLRVGGRQLRVAARSPQGATSVQRIDEGATSAGWVDLGTRGPGTDTAGRLFFANWRTIAGGLLRVVFERPLPAQPVVMLTPRNARAAGASLFVELDEDDAGTIGFRVSTGAPLEQSDEVLLVDYFVVGRE
ncbi:hypothetical protein ACTJKO_07125 [Curtobacterium sp. 22159]|uniref:hypothetical protein n=1 Tax=Curtobacterium sp. 22159 TaxID=3453882 RepID=UPI003F84BA81